MAHALSLRRTAGSRRPATSHHRARAGPLGADRPRARAFLCLFLFVAARWPSSPRRCEKGVAAYLAAVARAGRPGRHPADAADRGHRRAAEPDLRRGGGLGHRQVRVPRQERPDHAHRPALRGLAGDLGPDLRPALRPAGPARALAGGTKTSRSSSPCPASCWRRSSSPSPSWPAS